MYNRSYGVYEKVFFVGDFINNFNVFNWFS